MTNSHNPFLQVSLMKSKIYICVNPLTAKDEISLRENLSFLWTWILRWVPKSVVTNASLYNILSSKKLTKDSENPGS